MDYDLRVEYFGAKGLGVVANRAFKKGYLIETAYILFVFNGFDALGDKEDLDRFPLAWGPRKVAMLSGFTHLYNHSNRPNIFLERNLTARCINVVAKRNIKAGEELCYKYACKPWFKVLP